MPVTRYVLFNTIFNATILICPQENPVQLWSCDRGREINQLWAITPDKFIKLAASDTATAVPYCLDASNGSGVATKDGVVVNPCNETLASQKWYRVNNDGNGGFQLQNSFTGRCLAVSGSGYVNGAQVITFPCNTQRGRQLWSYQTVMYGKSYISPYATYAV